MEELARRRGAHDRRRSLHGVRSGSSLSEALAKHHPRPFSRLYINMVRAGEKGGVLEVSLRRLAEFLEARAAFNEAVVSPRLPARHPDRGAAAVVFLMTFVIPRFAIIFNDLGQAIPLPTQILMSVSAALQSYWWVLATLIMAACWPGACGPARRRVGRAGPVHPAAADRRTLALKVETARFARTLGTMLKSGVPVLGAMAVVAT